MISKRPHQEASLQQSGALRNLLRRDGAVEKAWKRYLNVKQTVLYLSQRVLDYLVKLPLYSHAQAMY